MGCFGINGAISKLPITYGDECILFFGVSNLEIYRPSPFSFGTGYYFTPITLPIIGNYDDYGRIENVKRDKNVEVIEEIFEINIDDAMSYIDDLMADRKFNSTKEEEFSQKILNKLNIDSKKYSLTFIIEHKFVYDTISKLKINSGYSFEESLKLTKELPYTLKDCIQKYHDGDYFDWLIDFNKKFSGNNSVTNINPNFKEGFYSISSYYNSSILMCAYCDSYVKYLLEDLADYYVNFLYFFNKMNILDWNLVIHNYSGQSGLYHLKSLKDLCQNVLTFIDNKIENGAY